METQTNCSLVLSPELQLLEKKSKFLLSQTENLFQLNICSVSAWFLSNIDLLIQNTQLSAKSHYHSEGIRVYILCDGPAISVGGPWPGSPVDPAQESGGTWCKYWARGALQCWPLVLVQQGCYQCWNSYRSSLPHCSVNGGGEVLLHNERRQRWWLHRGMLDGTMNKNQTQGGCMKNESLEFKKIIINSILAS